MKDNLITNAAVDILSRANYLTTSTSFFISKEPESI